MSDCLIQTILRGCIRPKKGGEAELEKVIAGNINRTAQLVTQGRHVPTWAFLSLIFWNAGLILIFIELYHWLKNGWIRGNIYIRPEITQKSWSPSMDWIWDMARCHRKWKRWISYMISPGERPQKSQMFKLGRKCLRSAFWCTVWILFWN